MALEQKQIIAVVVVVALAVTIGGIAFSLPGESPSNDTVAYHGNGGHTDDGADVWKVTNKTVLQNVFYSDTGRIFKEWNDKADGSGTSYKEGDPVEGGTDLYAIWYQHKTLGYSSSGSTSYVPLLEINSRTIVPLGQCGFDYADVNQIATYDNSITWDSAVFDGEKFVFSGTKLGDDGNEYRYTVELKATDEDGKTVFDTDREPIILNDKYPLAYLVNEFGDVSIDVNVKVNKVL
ncbi:MAG: hypothetical protein ACI4Q9_05040 [Candidatus Methanomethylophilaceae archaeon]